MDKGYDRTADDLPHRRRMRRIEMFGQARFLTFSCYRRLPLLNNDKIRDLFLARLSAVCSSQQIRLLGWVLMPEHLNLVVFPDGQPDFERFCHALKRPVAETVLRRWEALRASILKRIEHGTGYRFWQAGGGYDRNLTTPQEVREKIEYLHNNPVRRGIVENAIDYPWSSAPWYAGVPDAKLPCEEFPW